MPPINAIAQCLLLCAWLISLGIMFSRLAQVVARTRISFLGKAESYPSVNSVRYRTVLSRSSVDGGPALLPSCRIPTQIGGLHSNSRHGTQCSPPGGHQRAHGNCRHPAARGGSWAEEEPGAQPFAHTQPSTRNVQVRGKLAVERATSLQGQPRMEERG